MGALQVMAEQLPGKPFVGLHPDGLISQGAKPNIIGTVRSARIDGDGIVVELDVTPQGQQFIDAGNRELSVGYESVMDGQRYQKAINIDHLAAVPRGRCGSRCRLDGEHMDHHDHEHHHDEYLPGTMPTDMPGTKSNLLKPCNCGCVTCQKAGVSVGAALAGAPDAGVVGAPLAISVPGATTIAMSDEHSDGTLNAAGRKALSASEFAVPSRSALPINDEGHVRAAMSRFKQEKFHGPAERKSAFHKIVAKAHELGMDPKGFMDSNQKHLDDNDPDGGDGMKMAGDAADAPSGGGGTTSTSPANFAAPDIHAKLAAALTTIADATARADAAEKALDALKLDAYNARKDADAEKARADSAEKDRDDLKARADAAEQAAGVALDKLKLDADTEFTSRVQAAASARAELLAAAQHILPSKDADGKPAFDYAKMSDDAIKVAVIQHVDHFDGVPEATLIPGMYVGAVGRADRVAKANAAVNETLLRNRLDGQPFAKDGKQAEAEAKSQMTDQAANAWMTRK